MRDPGNQIDVNPSRRRAQFNEINSDEVYSQCSSVPSKVESFFSFRPRYIGARAKTRRGRGWWSRSALQNIGTQGVQELFFSE